MDRHENIEQFIRTVQQRMKKSDEDTQKGGHGSSDGREVDDFCIDVDELLLKLHRQDVREIWQLPYVDSFQWDKLNVSIGWVAAIRSELVNYTAISRECGYTLSPSASSVKLVDCDRPIGQRNTNNFFHTSWSCDFPTNTSSNDESFNHKSMLFDSADHIGHLDSLARSYGDIHHASSDSPASGSPSPTSVLHVPVVARQNSLTKLVSSSNPSCHKSPPYYPGLEQQRHQQQQQQQKQEVRKTGHQYDKFCESQRNVSININMRTEAYDAPIDSPPLMPRRQVSIAGPSKHLPW
jgi:hypothetical protein